MNPNRVVFLHLQNKQLGIAIDSRVPKMAAAFETG